MSNVLVRDVPPDALERLKARAKRRGRSLQAELQRILIEASVKSDIESMTFEEAVRLGDDLREQLKGKIKGSSADMIREDRASR